MYQAEGGCRLRTQCSLPLNCYFHLEVVGTCHVYCQVPSTYCPPSLGHRLQAFPRDSHSFLEASTTTTTLPASYLLGSGDLPAKDRPALMLRGSWEELAPQQPHQACLLHKPPSPTAHSEFSLQT